jgi:hydrogenase maturation protease
MIQALVIGYGNPLMGDDGLGIEAVRLLGERIGDRSVEIIAIHQLVPELAEPLSRVDQAIFIDARLGEIAGRIQEQWIEPKSPSPSSFTHQTDPAGLLDMALKLYGEAPRCSIVVSIAGHRFDPGEGLSAEVLASLPALVDRVDRLLGKSCVGTSPFEMTSGKARPASRSVSRSISQGFHGFSQAGRTR